MLEFAPISGNLMSYDEAILYCQFLEYNGHRDWRLPTYCEWDTSSEVIGWFLDDTWAKSAKVTPVRNI